MKATITCKTIPKHLQKNKIENIHKIVANALKRKEAEKSKPQCSQGNEGDCQ